MLEITSGEFADDILKRANKHFGLFPDSEYISMDLYLICGDISDLDNLSDRNIIG